MGLLDALLHISISGTPANSPDSKVIVEKAPRIYQQKERYKNLNMLVPTETKKTMATQTTIDITGETEGFKKLEKDMKNTKNGDYLVTNFIDDDSPVTG